MARFFPLFELWFWRRKIDAPPPTPIVEKEPPRAALGSPPPPPRLGEGPPGISPPDPRAEAMRARFELDNAYREMRQAELTVQQWESLSLRPPERAHAQRLLEVAADLYREAYQGYREDRYLQAVEYAMAVKDLVRVIDKLYRVSIEPRRGGPPPVPGVS